MCIFLFANILHRKKLYFWSWNAQIRQWTVLVQTSRPWLFSKFKCEGFGDCFPEIGQDFMFWKIYLDVFFFRFRMILYISSYEKRAYLKHRQKKSISWVHPNLTSFAHMTRNSYGDCGVINLSCSISR